MKTIMLLAGALALVVVYRTGARYQRRINAQHARLAHVRELVDEVNQVTRTLNDLFKVMPRHEFVRHPATRNLVLTSIKLRERLISERGTELEGEKEDLNNLYLTIGLPLPDPRHLH